MPDDARWTTHPVTATRFDDFADVINPNRRDTHCWCLSHRLRVQEIDELGAAAGRTRPGPWPAGAAASAS